MIMEIRMNINGTQAGRAEGMFDADYTIPTTSPTRAGWGTGHNSIINDGCFGGGSRCRPYPPYMPTPGYPGQHNPIGSVQQMLQTLLQMLQRMLGGRPQPDPGLLLPPSMPKPLPPMLDTRPPGSGPEVLPPWKLPYPIQRPGVTIPGQWPPITIRPEYPIKITPGIPSWPTIRPDVPIGGGSQNKVTERELRANPDMLVGLSASEAHRIALSAGIGMVRILDPKAITTMEVNRNRLTIRLDEQGRVRSARWN